MNWETIIFFGDSLTFGARDYLGFPEHCGNALINKLSKDWNIINHATNGFRAIDLARSISNNYDALSAHSPLMSVLLIGTNDAKSATSEEDYSIAIEQIIIKAKLLTSNNNVLILAIPNLVNGVAYPYNSEMNKFIGDYNLILDKLSKKHKIHFLTIPLKDKHFVDGVHFNNSDTIHFSEKIVGHILNDRGL